MLWYWRPHDINQTYPTTDSCCNIWHSTSAVPFINADIWTSCETFPWLLSIGDNIKIPCSMPPHIRHFDHLQHLNWRHLWLLSTYISCFNLSPGTWGSRIWCSTFFGGVWQFYLKDMLLFSHYAICHLKFHPHQPKALEPSLAMFLRAPWLPMDGQPWGNQIK